MMKATIAPFLAGPLLLGCAAGPHYPGPPLAALRDRPLECSGNYRHHGLTAPEDNAPPASVNTPLCTSVAVVRTRGEIAADLLDETSPGALARIVDAGAADAALRWLDGAQRAATIRRAAMSLPPGRPSDFIILNQTALITDFKLQAKRAAMILDPVVTVENAGLRIHLQATPQAAGEPWRIECRLELAELQQPIPTVSLATPMKGDPVTIQIPVFAHLELKSNAAVADGEALLLTAPDPAIPGGALMVFLHPVPPQLAAKR